MLRERGRKERPVKQSERWTENVQTKIERNRELNNKKIEKETSTNTKRSGFLRGSRLKIHYEC